MLHAGMGGCKAERRKTLGERVDNNFNMVHKCTCGTREGVAMKLVDWIRDNRVKRAEFAAEIDLSQGMLSRICNGYLPSPAAMIRIAAATKGAVLPNDFFEGLPTREDRAA